MNWNIKIIFPALLTALFASCQAQQGLVQDDVEVDSGKIVLDSAIWSIYQDSRGDFWLGSNGSGVYKKSADSLEHYDREDGLAGNQIRGIQEDSKGNLYFDTPDGISKFDGSSFVTLKTVRSNDWKLNKEDLWFKGSGDLNGVYRYDGSILHFLTFPEQDLQKAFGVPFPERAYSPYGIYGVYKDSKGEMWFGTLSAGVYHYDGDTLHWIAEQELTGLEDGRVPGIRSIIEDKNGEYWLSNTRFKYTIDRSHGFQYEKTNGQTGAVKMEFPYFLASAKDQAGNVWMITYSEGVYCYDGEKLRHYPVYNGDQKVLLYTVYIDRNGQLWLGSHNAGVLKFDGESFQINSI